MNYHFGWERITHSVKVIFSGKTPSLIPDLKVFKLPDTNELACLYSCGFYRKNTFGTLFEIEIVVKIERKQTIQTFGKEGDKTMETKLTGKRERFLSKVESALEVMTSISTEEDTAMGNVILRDLIRLENSASSGSVSLSGDCDQEGNLSPGDGFIVVENPMTFAHCLN